MERGGRHAGSRKRKRKGNREMDAKDAKANLQMGRTEEREAKIKMECRSEKAGTSKGSTAAVVAVKAAREESAKRWRKEQWINDPWLEG